MVGLLLGWLILAELPTLFGVIGMAIVLLGSLLLADRSQSSAAVEQTAELLWHHRARSARSIDCRCVDGGGFDLLETSDAVSRYRDVAGGVEFGELVVGAGMVC